MMPNPTAKRTQTAFSQHSDLSAAAHVGPVDRSIGSPASF